MPEIDEVKWFDEQLAAQHYLGAGRPVGDYLRQIVERDGHAVALLVWGPACYALKYRDLWISWSASQRVERLKLIVQNRRFLVLAPKGESPNLASPLHCQRRHARIIVEKGGDYLLQIKGNQPNLLRVAQGLDAVPGTPFLPTATPAMVASKSGNSMPLPSSPSPPTSPLPAP